jgi:PAS domain S-box-containing protein
MAQHNRLKEGQSTEPAKPQPWIGWDWRVVVGLAVAYGFAAWVGLAATFGNSLVSALWPPAGVSIGVLVLFGPRYGLVAGLMNAALLAFLGAPPEVCALVAGVNLLDYCAAALALRAWLNPDRTLARVSDVALFFAVTIVAPLPAALIGPWATGGLGFGDPGYATQAVIWWCGDVAGIVLFTPLVLICRLNLPGAWMAARHLKGQRELMGLLTIAGGLALVVFGDPWQLGASAMTLAYGVLLILLWGALRLGQIGAVLGVIMLVMPAMLFTSSGQGPFASGDLLVQVLLLLGFSSIASALALFLSAALAERNLEAQRSRILSRAVEQSATGVIIADAGGRIGYVNSAFTALTGYQREEVIGRNPRFLKSGHTSEDDYHSLWRTIIGGQTWRGDFLNRRKDGGVVWEHTVISPLRNEQGQITHFVATAEDITARKEAEAALRQALDSTERARAELERITFAVTHTLQEPLRSIGGFAQLLKKRYSSVLDENGLGYVERVVDGADRMHHLFHDLMHYVMVDEAVSTANINLTTVVRDAVQSLGPDAEKATTCQPLPAVRGVERQLVRVFEHLIGNALKYHHPDRVPAVSISLVQSPSDGAVLPNSRPLEKRSYGVKQGLTPPQWHICVADNGIGVDPAFTPRLFTLFSRLHTMDRYEGTGVGLAYCRRVIEHHGGSIWMEARDPYGTEIHLTLPCYGEPVMANDRADLPNPVASEGKAP